MRDDSMDDLMGRALREVDPVPPTPREEMWARIQAERAAGRPVDSVPGDARDGSDAGVIDLQRRRRRRTWVPWSAAVAATLVLGIGLGRMSLPDRDATAPVAVTPSDTGVGSTEREPVPAAYRVAATNHLERTETLLVSLSVDAQPGGTDEMTSRARELLTDTRLLLSSPAADDAATRRLLEDLELILTQIAGIPEFRAQQEVELIHAGINQSDVLLRLRAATAGPRLVGT